MASERVTREVVATKLHEMANEIFGESGPLRLFSDHLAAAVLFMRADAAEITHLRAELAEAQRERDALHGALQDTLANGSFYKEADVDRLMADRDAAKAEAERLREALAALILDIDGKNLRINLDAMRDARSALQEIAMTDTPTTAAEMREAAAKVAEREGGWRDYHLAHRISAAIRALPMPSDDEMVERVADCEGVVSLTPPPRHNRHQGEQHQEPPQEGKV